MESDEDNSIECQEWVERLMVEEVPVTTTAKATNVESSTKKPEVKVEQQPDWTGKNLTAGMKNMIEKVSGKNESDRIVKVVTEKPEKVCAPCPSTRPCSCTCTS